MPKLFRTFLEEHLDPPFFGVDHDALAEYRMKD